MRFSKMLRTSIALIWGRQRQQRSWV